MGVRRPKPLRREEELVTQQHFGEGGWRQEHARAIPKQAEQSVLLLQGAEADYVDDLTRSGLTIPNPNAVHNCACGHSFQTAQGGGSPKSCC